MKQRWSVRTYLWLLALAVALPAQAYCVYNQLSTRDVVVSQETTPDPLREPRRFLHRIKPGEHRCCAFHNLDCNPGGRQNSVVVLQE